MKFKAPKDCCTVSVGGETFNVNKKGVIDVGDLDVAALLLPHGFTPVGEAPAPAAEDASADGEDGATDGEQADAAAAE